MFYYLIRKARILAEVPLDGVVCLCFYRPPTKYRLQTSDGYFCAGSSSSSSCSWPCEADNMPELEALRTFSLPSLPVNVGVADPSLMVSPTESVLDVPPCVVEEISNLPLADTSSALTNANDLSSFDGSGTLFVLAHFTSLRRASFISRSFRALNWPRRHFMIRGRTNTKQFKNPCSGAIKLRTAQKFKLWDSAFKIATIKIGQHM